MNRRFALLTSLFTVSILPHDLCAQICSWNRWESKFVGSVLVINRRCDFSGSDYKNYDLRTLGLRSEDQEIRFPSPIKESVIASLRKGLEWAKTNESKSFVFKKRIAEISLKVKYCRGDQCDNFTKVQMVFEAEGNSQYSIIIYGDDRKADLANVKTKYGRGLEPVLPPFSIERPGGALIIFNSKQEVDEFVALLNQKGADLNNIFK